MCKYCQFEHLLTKVCFDCTVDHLAPTYIMESKTEPTSARIKRLLEVIAYSFNLYYMKGKDMMLSNFLSRIRVEKSMPYEIIPISFDFQEVLQKYYIWIRSGTQKASMAVRQMHRHVKLLLPHLKPEKAAKILSLLPSSPSLNQPQWVTNDFLRRGIGRASLRGKYQVQINYSYCYIIFLWY